MSTPPSGSTLLNVCVIPSDQVGVECVRLSKLLPKEGKLFELGDGKFPHMTAYMARFGNDQVDNVVNAVRATLARVRSLPCEHSGYFTTAGDYVEVSYAKSPQFVDLQKLIIGAAKDFRLNPGKPFEEGYFTPYTLQQQANAQATGYDLACWPEDLFRPHVTLTRYKKGQAPVSLPDFGNVQLSFRLWRICVYKADNNGAVSEELASFPIAL
ncbi:hypothetical protein KW786_03215 [Candidatus Parcubacteria bacterium]|nr:hypothetical protein [Candidatus Parcubacteria bacterium]